MLDPAKIGRLGELDHPPERSHRVRKINDGWYFTTREERMAGPYTTRAQAQKNADDYVRFSMVYSAEVLSRLLDHIIQDDGGLAADMSLTA